MKFQNNKIFEVSWRLEDLFVSYLQKRRDRNPTLARVKEKKHLKGNTFKGTTSTWAKWARRPLL